MKILKKKEILMLFVICLITLCNSSVYASNLSIELTQYSQEYKEWLELSDEEKKEVVQPIPYDIITKSTNNEYLENISNPLKLARLVTTTNMPAYDLRDVIPENVAIRDQMSTNSCWAFTGIGVLESYLGLQNYKNSEPVEIYDYSERHLTYSSYRDIFIGNDINEKGVNDVPSNGGTVLMVMSYFLNDSGAVLESDMPFVNSEEEIQISEIQNKDIMTTVNDMVFFEGDIYDQVQLEDTKNSAKQHIRDYGALGTNIHGASIQSNYYNNETGAIYCDNSILAPANHGTTIIGWDDNYSRTNFNEDKQPDNNGAWIIKNSWGESIKLTMEDAKQELFNAFTGEMISKGWNTAEEIPDEEVKNIYIYSGYTYNEGGNKFEYKIGDNGYMYISYEDVNVNKFLWGIKNASDEKEYEKIYQHDLTGPSGAVRLNKPRDENVLLANVFERDTQETEYIDSISIFTYEEYNNCKVYINPNGDGKTLADLQEVELAEGATVDVLPGNKVIDFKTPIAVSGDSFVIVLEVDGTDTYSINISGEMNSSTMYEDIIKNPGESFVTSSSQTEESQWLDLYDIDNGIGGNISLKALTVSSQPQVKEVSRIEIAQQPNKLVYEEGEDFDKTGMIVNAIYDDLTVKEITNYTIENGQNLLKGQQYITIKYTENNVVKEVNQSITVNEKTDIPTDTKLEKIEIKVEPNKTNYKEGEDFDKTGMIVNAIYEDLTQKEVTNYTIENSQDLKINQTSVEISYTENGVTRVVLQEITVNENTQNMEHSDFSNINTTSENVVLQTFTDSRVDYITMKIVIQDIMLAAKNSNYSFRYYISGKSNEQDIPEEYWMDIEENEISNIEDGRYKMEIEFDSRDLKNVIDILESEKLFIYIEEIIDSQMGETNNISVMQIQSPQSYTYYKDGVETELEIEVEKPNLEDETLAPNPLPDAGIKVIIPIMIISIIIIGSISYIRYKTIDK